jgi:hypothetical protein
MSALMWKRRRLMTPSFVITGLVPVISIVRDVLLIEMAGTSPAMTWQVSFPAGA